MRLPMWLLCSFASGYNVISRSALQSVAVLLSVEYAFGHGSLSYPASRNYGCYKVAELQNSDGCEKHWKLSAVRYDNQSIRQGNANGKHHEVVKSGSLCSGSNESFSAVDKAPASLWKATTLKATNGEYTFKYWYKANHKTTYFKFYVTKDGWNQDTPLTWEALDAEPFCTYEKAGFGPPEFECPSLEPKNGRHIIFTIWQRGDSPEAFYACSDVNIGSGGGTAGNVQATLGQSVPDEKKREEKKGEL